MTLVKIFVVVLLAVVIGGLILKYGWKGILKLLIIVLCIPLLLLEIILMPFKIIFNKMFVTRGNCQRKIIRNYDKIFFEAKTRKEIQKAIKEIAKCNRKLNTVDYKKEDKKTVKFLNSVKWTL